MNLGRVLSWLPGWTLLLCLLIPANAHPALFTSAEIYIQPDGRYQFFTTFDLLAFALHRTSMEIGDPPMNALLDGSPEILNGKIEEAHVYFHDGTKLDTDRGPGTVTRLRFPSLQDVEDWKASGRKPRLPVVARVEMDGALPPTASRVEFRFPATLGTVVLTVNRPGDDVYDGMIDPGFMSSPVPIRLDLSGAGSSKNRDGTPLPRALPVSSTFDHLGQKIIGCLGIFLVLLFALRLLTKQRMRNPNDKI